MEASLWIHPAVAVVTLLLLGATALSKMRRKKYYRVHYSLASATVVGVIVTFGLAVNAVVSCDCPDDWPVTLFIHFPIALILTGLVLGQATMGVTMLLFGRKRRLLRTHRINARIILGSAAMVLVLGLTTVALLLVD